MFCQIKDRATPVTLGQMRAGDLFVVEGVRDLQHCVCVVAVMEKLPVDCSKDSFISVVVVACAKPAHTAGYAPAGYEIDLVRETPVTRVEQTQIALFSAKAGAFEGALKPLDKGALEAREVLGGRTLYVSANIDLDALLGKGDAPVAAPSKL